MGFTDSEKGGLISAAGSLIGQGVSAIAQGSMNKKTRAWNEKMYALQRENALADWNQQNAYNSPAQQMQRLKDAGLNPNLVYGNGAEANSTAMPRQSTAPTWNPRAPQFDAGSVTGAYYDTLIKKQTLTNMDAVEKTQRLQAIKVAAETANLGIAGARSKFDLDLATGLKDNTIARSSAELERLYLGNQFTKDANNRANLMVQGNLSKMAQDMAESESRTANNKATAGLIRANVSNAIKDGIIKDFEIELNKAGLTKSDPNYMRISQGFIKDIMSGEFHGAGKRILDNAQKFKDYINGKLRSFGEAASELYTLPFRR